MQPTNDPHKGNLQLGKPLSSHKWVEYGDDSWELTNGKTRCLNFQIILEDLPNITGTWVGLNSISVPTATRKSVQAFLIFLLHSFSQPTFTEVSHLIGAWDFTWPWATSTNTCLRTHSCLTSRFLKPPPQMWVFQAVWCLLLKLPWQRARKRKELVDVSSNKCPLPGSRPG